MCYFHKKRLRLSQENHVLYYSITPQDEALVASALAFSLNSRAGLNVLWAKTLNIGLFQMLLPAEGMAHIWSILNYF